MAINKIGDVRPSQLITTFGPGAIIDAKRDCVTILDINYWEKNGKEIKDSRFASYMGVDFFKEPPTTTNRNKNSEDLPVVSFPDYHICSKVSCSYIFKLSEHFDVEKYKKFGPKCPKCNFNAYPSRFIQICPNGHMEDFDYNRWVHKGTSCDGELKLISTGTTSSLGDLMVTCTKCNATRSLAGLTSPENNCSCNGHHPFRPAISGEKCRAQMRIVQRGASNVYFPVIKSAISIPPYTDRIYVLIDEHKRELESFRAAKKLNPTMPDPEELLYQMFFSTEFSKDDFTKALKNSENGTRDYLSIKKSEYLAIINHNNPVNMRSPQVFKAEESEIPSILKPYFSRVIRITRLREIMCLKGFTRLDAPDPEAEEQVNIVKLNTSKKWLPGVEVNGEGIFIEFNKESIDFWLKKKDVKQIDDKFKKCFKRYSEKRGWTIVYERGALYALMHTFSHLLIKVMGNKSGYSTSAIKERIYSGDNMMGILLYTGSSDKEGSLGGLVELGKFEKFIPIIQTAFEEALLCTNDPECMLNDIDENLNISACHSCCMISETACENGNRMLDRGLIVPINEECDKSFFSDLVKEMCEIE